MKGFLKDFKSFIARGNVMDLAVGVIIGGAFKAIVDSLVKDILMPVIGGVTGGIDLSSLAVTIGEASISYGLFLNAIINFLIIALVIFLMVKGLAKARDLAERKNGAEEEAAAAEAEEILLLREIRDSLKK